ncbi:MULTISPECIES: YibL family ribosome-associated protein [unclassified Agarivorans]|uniref:YibL family ribosome-associated protein n=1 Tax=unclassified Agarivorans TaxID=2636026 RepID=UPI0026E1879A|nr:MULTISPECIES: YibL family ribosome-associated protein [unclassified Agarivorans]MDO6685895.1 YibL family ribosome-associated protein [Agarivorans sp. 3_MG-2023]MDO6713967.1 YibL family ribosome-associated protein [Agarivorans sp. 2_MG-2023]MDO6762299.1 YibL family ribosome-associated protein [Agarivorans sp. 1_MG-2023]
MNLKNELQTVHNKLETAKRKLNAAHDRGDTAMISQFNKTVEILTKKLKSVKAQQTKQLSQQGGDVKSLPFSRVLTKQEQADMGKLKKSVKGLVVVHPMTALGREMGIKEVTGYASKEF